MENCQNKVCSDGSFEILDIEEVEFQGKFFCFCFLLLILANSWWVLGAIP